MKYLTVEDIIKINVMVIGKYSPEEPIGIADLDSLQMIVEQPKQEIFENILYPDIYSKAAIIWINLIKKHPFYNANKRTAVLALHMFLALNGYKSNLSLLDGLEKTIEIATFQGDFENLKQTIIDFLKQDGNIIKL